MNGTNAQPPAAGGPTEDQPPTQSLSAAEPPKATLRQPAPNHQGPQQAQPGRPPQPELHHAPIANEAAPIEPDDSKKPKRARPYLIGAATFMFVAMLGGAFAGGWYVANQTNSAPPAPQPTMVEVPALAPANTELRMPDVRGLDENTAMQAIADAGVDVSNVSVSTQPAAGAAGKVIEQTPAFGTEAPSEVSLVISEVATIPNVIGTTSSEATASLSILGAGVTVESRYEADKAEGAVLEVFPEVGEAVPENVVLTVNVAPSSQFLSTMQLETGNCYDEETVIGGEVSPNALTCSAYGGSDPEASSWLLAGATDRFHATVGIPDAEKTDSRGTIDVRIDGKSVQKISVAWGKTTEIDIPTTGALKLEIVVSSKDGAVIGLAEAQVLGDPSQMTKLGAS